MTKIENISWIAAFAAMVGASKSHSLVGIQQTPSHHGGAGRYPRKSNAVGVIASEARKSLVKLCKINQILELKLQGDCHA